MQNQLQEWLYNDLNPVQEFFMPKTANSMGWSVYPVNLPDGSQHIVDFTDIDFLNPIERIDRASDSIDAWVDAWDNMQGVAP